MWHTGSRTAAARIRVARSAPSKSNLQQADIVAVRNPARRNAIHALVPGMPWMADAPTLLEFCANGRRFKRLFDRCLTRLPGSRWPTRPRN
jgi:nitroreductase